MCILTFHFVVCAVREVMDLHTSHYDVHTVGSVLSRCFLVLLHLFVSVG